MNVREHRLQLLLDQVRYDGVDSEAARTGRSVAAVIREAIDFRFPSGDRERAAALESFLAMPVEATEPGEDWRDIKSAIEDDIASRR